MEKTLKEKYGTKGLFLLSRLLDTHYQENGELYPEEIELVMEILKDVGNLDF